MAKNDMTADGEVKAKRTRTPRAKKIVLVFDDFDGAKFHGLSVHNIDASIVDVITNAAAQGRKAVQVEIPPASSGD